MNSTLRFVARRQKWFISHFWVSTQLICTSDCGGINLFGEEQSLKFHVLVLIMKFFNFIESFYGRHQHRLAWDMNILGKIWINLKFSNNIIGSLADFNIATTEAPATKPTTHSTTSAGFTVTQNRPSEMVPSLMRSRYLFFHNLKKECLKKTLFCSSALCVYWLLEALILINSGLLAFCISNLFWNYNSGPESALGPRNLVLGSEQCIKVFTCELLL